MNDSVRSSVGDKPTEISLNDYSQTDIALTTSDVDNPFRRWLHGVVTDTRSDQRFKIRAVSSAILVEHFSGPGIATDMAYACVCLSVSTITFKLNDL